LLKSHSNTDAERCVTWYTNACLKSVDDAYDELVDYLMFKYVYRYPDAAPPKSPILDVPAALRVARN
jgi:hypothetical protein